MKLLLDSHTFLWAVEQPNKLSSTARSQLDDKSNELAVSAATIWEIAIKVGLAKLTLALPYGVWMPRSLRYLKASILPITVDFAAAQARLPLHHRDPFDRLLAAQSLVDNIPLVSNDVVFDHYGVTRIW